MSATIAYHDRPAGVFAIEDAIDPAAPASGIEPETDEFVDIHVPFDPTDIDIKTKNPSIDTLIKRLEHNEINLAPDFQRKAGIWTRTLKSRLIESLMLNIPLPVFYVAADADGNWIVVDGLQRLSTLDEYIRKQNFGLTAMEFLGQFNGYRFAELPRAMQRRILESEPVFHIIQPGCPKDVTRTIFKRINTSGMPLSLQEIRHALYQGPATRLLHELATGQAFVQATGGSIKDDRMADRECVLRYLAFEQRGVDEYRVSDLDAFLSDTLERLNTESDEQFNAYRARFALAMHRAHAIFGEQAFRKQRRGAAGRQKMPINKALFETWSVALGQLSDTEAAQLHARAGRLNQAFIELLEEDTDFVSAISATTGSTKSVHLRFQRVAALIAAELGQAS